MTNAEIEQLFKSVWIDGEGKYLILRKSSEEGMFYVAEYDAIKGIIKSAGYSCKMPISDMVEFCIGFFDEKTSDCRKLRSSEIQLLKEKSNLDYLIEKRERKLDAYNHK